VAPIFSVVYSRYTSAGSMKGFLPRLRPGLSPRQWLFCYPERYALLIQGKYNALLVLNAADQAIHKSHHQRITGLQELQQLQFAPYSPAVSADFFCMNDFTTGSAENLCPQGKILVAG